jgi:hypothetical protein
MSLVSGLVETGTEETIPVTKSSGFGEWAGRNAWRLVVGGSAVFWLAVIAAIVFG